MSGSSSKRGMKPDRRSRPPRSTNAQHFSPPTAVSTSMSSEEVRQAQNYASNASVSSASIVQLPDPSMPLLDLNQFCTTDDTQVIPLDILEELDLTLDTSANSGATFQNLASPRAPPPPTNATARRQNANAIDERNANMRLLHVQRPAAVPPFLKRNPQRAANMPNRALIPALPAPNFLAVSGDGPVVPVPAVPVRTVQREMLPPGGTFFLSRGAESVATSMNNPILCSPSSALNPATFNMAGSNVMPFDSDTLQYYASFCDLQVAHYHIMYQLPRYFYDFAQSSSTGMQSCKFFMYGALECGLAVEIDMEVFTEALYHLVKFYIGLNFIPFELILLRVQWYQAGMTPSTRIQRDNCEFMVKKLATRVHPGLLTMKDTQPPERYHMHLHVKKQYAQILVEGDFSKNDPIQHRCLTGGTGSQETQTVQRNIPAFLTELVAEQTNTLRIRESQLNNCFVQYEEDISQFEKVEWTITNEIETVNKQLGGMELNLATVSNSRCLPDAINFDKTTQTEEQEFDGLPETVPAFEDVFDSYEAMLQDIIMQSVIFFGNTRIWLNQAQDENKALLEEKKEITDKFLLDTKPKSGHCKENKENINDDTEPASKPMKKSPMGGASLDDSDTKKDPADLTPDQFLNEIGNILDASKLWSYDKAIEQTPQDVNIEDLLADCDMEGDPVTEQMYDYINDFNLDAFQAIEALNFEQD